MTRNCLIGIATAAVAFSAAPALAHDDGGGYRNSVYDRDGRYYQPRRVSRNQVWRGRDGRYYCRRGNGTVGLVIGGTGGALIGRSLDHGRNRATGTILGAAAGALLGREVQRGMRCR